MLTQTLAGSLARIGPNELLDEDPELVRRIARHAKRLSSFKLVRRHALQLGNVLQWRDEDKHFKFRYKMVAVYSGREVDSPKQKVDDNLLGLLRLIEGHMATRHSARLTCNPRMAGSGTTATAIRATLLYMITNPCVHAKLLAQISSSPSFAHRPVAIDAEARGLLSRRVVIKKRLHIFPPVTGTMAKEAPAERDTWNKRFIPGVTCIGWSA
ncbi:Putative cytochrome P450 superfamily [Colletotrichum destructivum]|uniref:Cytochrome P450 superfamily n=1 Tax=Colletotrichum destructivum TaxID=34406 RepID=A0AAX4IZV9_9PEZI|nr:Putative cytochrome P450 superfamily [Colletotrichum destructivum]